MTYRRGDFEEEDNQFQFEADIWVADAENFEENSTHWLSAGAKVTFYVPFTLDESKNEFFSVIFVAAQL